MLMRVAFTFHFENARPSDRAFRLPAEGRRGVPVRLDGGHELNTVLLTGDANLVVPAGGREELLAEPLHPPAFASVQAGVSVLEIWDGDFFARGTVLERQE